jgi:lipoprotein
MQKPEKECAEALYIFCAGTAWFQACRYFFDLAMPHVPESSGVYGGMVYIFGDGSSEA